ncbi:MAG: PaaI family thioesterase [Planctomycetes bacterium]|nr:PaaI family thioesterase [Planctomycetota bacterium]
MITDWAEEALGEIQTSTHPNCVVCGRDNHQGLQLEFRAAADGSVRATFDCRPAYEGYADVLHGGVIAALLDGAMTNCLFAHGRPGVTAELTVRFRHPVRTGRAAAVRASIERCCPPLHVLKADLTQDGQVKATACGKFMDQVQIAAHRLAPVQA